YVGVGGVGGGWSLPHRAMASRRAIHGCSAAWLAGLLVLSVLLVDAPPVAAPSGTLHTVLTGLNFPTAFRFADDGRIFLLERFTGKIRIVENGSLLPPPFYTLANVATSAGLVWLGFALVPDLPVHLHVC